MRCSEKTRRRRDRRMLNREQYVKLQEELRKFYLEEKSLKDMGQFYLDMGLYSAATSCFTAGSEEYSSDDPTKRRYIAECLTKLAICYDLQGEGYIFESFCRNMSMYAIDMDDSYEMAYQVLAGHYYKKDMKFDELMVWKSLYRKMSKKDLLGKRMPSGILFLKILELSEQLFRIEKDSFYEMAEAWYVKHHSSLKPKDRVKYRNYIKNQKGVVFPDSIVQEDMQDEEEPIPVEKNETHKTVEVYKQPEINEDVPYTMKELREVIIPKELKTLFEYLPASSPQTFIQFTDDPWDNTGMLLTAEGFEGYSAVYVNEDRHKEYVRNRKDMARIVNGYEYGIIPSDFCYNGSQDKKHGVLLITFRDAKRTFEHLKEIPFSDLSFKAVIIRIAGTDDEYWNDVMTFMKLKGYTLKGSSIKVGENRVGCVLTRRR